jgi:hypothetical protein
MRVSVGVLSVMMSVILCSLSAEAFILVDVYRDGYIDDFTRDKNIPPDGIPERITDTNALLAGRGEFFDQFNAFNVDSRAVITFDVSAYAGMNLLSASLQGYGTRVDNKGSFDAIDGQFYLYSGDGEVGLDDFNASAVSLGGKSFADNPEGFNLDPFSLDITSSLQDLLNNSNHFAEIRVQSPSPTVFINAGEVDPNSGFQTDSRWPGPKLALEFDHDQTVPEPSTLLLLGGGLAAVCLRRKRS